MKDKIMCNACGICIGPDYMERHPVPVGKKVICGWCKGKMEERGYIEVGQLAKVVEYLMPDGKVGRFNRRSGRRLEV